MKKICVYLAVLLVLAAFGMTIFAHAGDLPPVPLTHGTDNGLTEVDTEYEVSLSFPDSTEPLRLNKTQVQLIYRQKETLTASDSVTWQSDNNAVVTVDTSGKLTAVGVGTATITAVTDDERTAACTVTVQYAWWQQLIRFFLFGWLWY